MHIRKFIGLAGVAKSESKTAQIWGRRFDLSMIFIAIWLPLQLLLQRQQQLSALQANLANWLVWLFFTLETTYLAYLVDNKTFYLRSNWLNLIIILGGFPLVWEHTPLVGLLRSFQLLLMIRLFVPWWDSIINVLSYNRFGVTLVVIFLVTILSGILLALIEPNIVSLQDGIWWAWETVTTVGYGDIVPHTLSGRILAIILMLLGLALVSILTANFSAYLIGRSTQRIKKKEDEMISLMHEMQKQLTHIRTEIEQLKQDKNDIQNKQ